MWFLELLAPVIAVSELSSLVTTGAMESTGPPLPRHFIILLLLQMITPSSGTTVSSLNVLEGNIKCAERVRTKQKAQALSTIVLQVS